MPAITIDNRKAMRASNIPDIEEAMVAKKPTNGTFARSVFLRAGFGLLSRSRLSNREGFPFRLCRACGHFEDRLRLAIRGSFNDL
jgi:hypothetical protein